MPFNNSISWNAGGALLICSFAAIDTTADEQVVQATSGNSLAPVGVVADAQKNAPGLTGSDNTKAATAAGDMVRIFMAGDDCLIKLGTGGCTAGDYLKPDSTGLAVTASSTNVVGAYALQAGNASAFVRCVVLPRGSKMP